MKPIPSASPDAAASPDGVVVPPDSLGRDTLRRVIEEFVTREGTDYGAADAGLDEKVAAVARQLAKGDAALVFDPKSGSIGIVPQSRTSGSNRRV